MSKSNAKLKAYYKRYNKKYFGGKLPDINIRFGETHRKFVIAETIFLGGHPSSIVIYRKFKRWDKIVLQSLLHEMVHVSLPVKIVHGPKFEAEMQRLAKLGAFKNVW